MTEGITLADVLKTAPTATALSSLSIMLLSPSGDVQRLNSQVIPYLVSQKINADEILQNGIFTLAFGSTGLPPGIGATDNILICLGNGNYWFQIFLRIGGGGMIYIRIYSTDHWEDWKQVI